MGYKKLSNEQEQQLVQEYLKGASVVSLMKKYGFKTKKSITDKVKKHYPDTYKDIVAQAQVNRKDYDYCLEHVDSEFNAYFLGLLLTDGYISRETDIGIDLIDEDCIDFLSKTIGKDYKTYEPASGSVDTQGISKRHRLIFSNKDMVNKIARLGVVEHKTYDLQPPQLNKEEEKYIPYIIRGIIDGDGCVSPTSYGAPQFYIATKSKDFADWIVDILTNKMYMIDIHCRYTTDGVWRIETANQGNILKLISMVYNKPFGMSRKYQELRKTFRDYNSDPLLETE